MTYAFGGASVMPTTFCVSCVCFLSATRRKLIKGVSYRKVRCSFKAKKITNGLNHFKEVSPTFPSKKVAIVPGRIVKVLRLPCSFCPELVVAFCVNFLNVFVLLKAYPYSSISISFGQYSAVKIMLYSAHF